jgi:ABC-type sugar transport system permease subunit
MADAAVKIENPNKTDGGSLSAKKKKRRAARTVFIVTMLAYPILQFLVFWLYVNVNTVVMTFQRFNMTTGKNSFVGFANYETLFRDLFVTKNSALKWGIINSFTLFPFNNFVLLPLSVVCAYLLFKKLFGYKVFRVIFFLPNIISIVVLTMMYIFMLDYTVGPFQHLLQAVGIKNFVPGTTPYSFHIVLAYCLWAGIGYNVVLFTGAMQRIPEEVLESGRIDGAGMRSELFRIIVPMIFPTISTLFIVGITVVFTLFMQPLLINNGGIGESSFTIALYVVQNSQGTENTKAATVGLLFSAIAVPVVFGAKYLLERLAPQADY